MNLKSLILGAAGALLIAGGANAQLPPGWSAPGEPLRIADNLYYVGTQTIAVYLITTPKGHILVDGACPPARR